MRADEADAHAGGRPVFPAQDQCDVADAGPLVRDPDVQHLREAFAFERELHLAAAGVAECVARDLGNGRGDARLILPVEAEQAGDLPRALARDDHVLLELDGDGQKRFAHGPSEEPPRLRMTDDAHVVAAPIIVPIQHSGDQGRVPGREAGVGCEVPVRAQAVRSAAPAGRRAARGKRTPALCASCARRSRCARRGAGCVGGSFNPADDVAHPGEDFRVPPEASHLRRQRPPPRAFAPAHHGMPQGWHPAHVADEPGTHPWRHARPRGR